MCPCLLGWTKLLVIGLMAQVCMLSLVYNAKKLFGVLGMGYLLATHCCPDKLALNGPKSLTHDVRF